MLYDGSQDGLLNIIIGDVGGEVLFGVALGVSVVLACLVVGKGIRPVGVRTHIAVAIGKHDYNKLIQVEWL